jgi:hypothetical protein
VVGIQKRCEGLYQNRNILAHSPVITVTAGDPPKTDLVLRRNFDQLNIKLRRIHVRGNKEKGVAPREMDPSKEARWKNAVEEQYDAKQIAAFATEFDELARRLRVFAEKLQPPTGRRAEAQPGGAEDAP